MKTIEERAKEYGSKKGDISLSAVYNEALANIYKEGYIAGATEQKTIDDEANYKQGYHDAIEKACERLRERIEGGVHPQSVYSFIEDFRKAMEE